MGHLSYGSGDTEGAGGDVVQIRKLVQSEVEVNQPG